MFTNSWGKNFLRSIYHSIIIGYALTALLWIILKFSGSETDFFKLYAAMFLIIFGVHIIFITAVDIRREGYFERLANREEEYGEDEEYFEIMRKYMGGCRKDEEKIVLASMCADSQCYEKSRRIIEEVEFSKLTPMYREEYFNLLLYIALNLDDMELANEIYHKAGYYFERAARRRSGADIVHTLGLFYLKNSQLQKAEECFKNAMRWDNESLVCECEIGLGWCELARGNKQTAKKQCYIAADFAKGKAQVRRLRQLMSAVEKAYDESGF